MTEQFYGTSTANFFKYLGQMEDIKPFKNSGNIYFQDAEETDTQYVYWLETPRVTSDRIKIQYHKHINQIKITIKSIDEKLEDTIENINIKDNNYWKDMKIVYENGAIKITLDKKEMWKDIDITE